MFQSFEQIQKLGQDNLNAALKAAGAVSSNAQVIATETAEYARKSFEQGSAVVEELLGAKSFDKAVEIQTAYAKGTFEGLVGQSAKMGALYSALAAEAFKPFEGFFPKTSA